MEDNVSFVHPEYGLYSTQIEKTRNVFLGVDSARTYLYGLERESENSLIKRSQNATLKNFVKRATEAFVGMIFRKPIDTTGFDERLINIANNIDKKRNLNTFARDVSTNLIVDGKVYVGIDSDVDGLKDPYCVMYQRSQVINWRQNSDGLYTLLVIKEYIDIETGSFATDKVIRYKVYKDDGNIDIYIEENDGTNFVETIETEYDYIPIVSFELSDIPPLYDIAKLTIKHMNRTSIKDKYLDMCATPIPLVWSPDVNSDDPTKPVFVIGADEGFVFNGTKEECNFEWRELEGTSIDKLQDDLSVIEEDITTGIIRAASSDTTTVKTATQAYYEAAESANRVVVIANIVESGLNKVFEILADIGNIEMANEARVIMNKDFNAIAGNSDSVRLLFETYLAGTLSIETFLDSLAKFELIDIGSVQDEITRIENDKFTPKPKEVTEETKESTDNRTMLEN